MDHSYLEAKRSLDDRSINQNVWNAFRAVALELAAKRKKLTLVEIGAGSGSMVERLSSWMLLSELSELTRLSYETVEPQKVYLPTLRARLTRRNELSSFDTFGGSVEEYLSVKGEGRADLLIAHAVLDLFSAPQAAELSAKMVAPEGVLYATITFDGESYFEPVADEELDMRVRRAYHQSMARDGVLGAGFGRKLLTELPRRGLGIVEAGSSDWILMPREGAYYPREGEFLKAILSMVESAVAEMVTEEERETWLRHRLRQLEAAELIYIAHQLDILARKG
ncbi:MAG: hypothetical protein ACOC47_00015 [Alkalispirochaetaceae bacterium]